MQDSYTTMTVYSILCLVSRAVKLYGIEKTIEDLHVIRQAFLGVDNKVTDEQIDKVWKAICSGAARMEKENGT